ncbi:MAG TPA: cysteine methyltransferase [Micromonosporaceae bacterium]|nr:cysteine methyltransferase [Micromonosporaceae bacterium]
MTAFTTFDSPLGELLIVGSKAGLTSVSVPGQRDVPVGSSYSADFNEVTRQLQAYFAGELEQFDLPLASPGTPFQERVWAAVEQIPYGTTISYGELARRVGAPRDRIRAVAAAVGANPLLLIRPCHRVIGSDGSLTGYAGGIERKRLLLTLEGALAPQLI